MNAMRVPLFCLAVAGCQLLSLPALSQPAGPDLSLEAAIDAAISQDPWLNGSFHREAALTSESSSAATLPDPRVSLVAANFPTDSFDINQEPMTQLTVGVTQMFPRGDSRQLSSRQKLELAAQEPLLRVDRQASVTTRVSHLWLEAYKAQQSIRLIEDNRSLFEHLVDATEASYSSAVGRARQQDIIRAQLELTRLDDRLAVLHQQLEASRQRLAQWIGPRAHLPLAPDYPGLELPKHMLSSYAGDERQLYQWVRRHPSLLALDKRIDANQTGVELARQQYQPEWGVTAQYGYRDDDPMGRDRADLFSVGLTFDLPLFTGNRQDQQVSAATARTEAMRTDRLLMARKLIADLQTERVRLQRLDQRQRLYRETLLPQMTEQAEAALAAYNNDDGDFAEAVRARIAELNARIEALAIDVQRQQTLADLRYLLASVDQPIRNVQP